MGVSLGLLGSVKVGKWGGFSLTHLGGDFDHGKILRPVKNGEDGPKIMKTDGWPVRHVCSREPIRNHNNLRWVSNLFSTGQDVRPGGTSMPLVTFIPTTAYRA